MNENTMHHFLRRLRDNGQDYQADRIERAMETPEVATKCDHKYSETEKIFKDGTHHIELRCSACNHFGGYKPQKNPSDVVVEFGKYKGETLGAIKSFDLAYLKWIAVETKGSISKYAQRLLEKA